MGSGKGSIVGNEQSEGKDYPSDWFCQCGHSFKKHPDDACEVKGEVKIHPQGTGWADTCMKYKPVDNLTYVELKAKEVLK